MYQLPFLTKSEIEEILIRSNLFDPDIKNAINQAVTSHTGQLRDSGQQYLEEHIYPIIASVVNKHKDQPFIKELLLTCILHDVIEDDDNASPVELTKTFGDKVISNVLYLTKTPQENAHGVPQEQKAKTNRQVLERLKSAPAIVHIAKLEDRLNNITCIDTVNNPKFVRYVEETKISYVPFAIFVNQPLYVGLLQQQITRLSQADISKL
jgi:(p)ppGpp synthase/HD superfamily hydrolase